MEIVSLSNEILLHILSYLPLKEAISLSIVSKEWHRMIRSLPCLCFDDASQSRMYEVIDSYASIEEIKDSNNFMNFVDRVLLNHNNDVVDIFSIRCGSCVDSVRLEGWIQYAISNNVRELDLELGLNNFKDFDRLPMRVFTCNRLEVLRVKINKRINFFCKVPAKICLPNLRTLHFDRLTLLPDADDKASIQRLISSCPMLEELEIRGGSLSKNYRFNVISSTLKRLRIGYMGNDYDQIHINAPNLVYLRCFYLLRRFSMKNLNSLVEARIDFAMDFDPIQENISTLVDLFKDISNVKCLYLSGYFEMVFLRLGSLMPKLHKLTHLMFDAAGLSYIREWERWIPALPQSFPNIETLDFDVKHIFDRKTVNLSNISPCSWSQLKNLNILSLEGKKFDHFLEEDKEIELQMIEYLLHNAESLEKLTLGKITSKPESAKWIPIARKKLLKLPKASSKCKIIVC